MDSNTMQRMRKRITDNEKEIPTPYKDNKGKLTVGAGFLVDDEASFVAMPFQVKDAKTGQPRPATEDEKKAEFQRAKGLSNDELRDGPGKSPLSLPKAEIERRLYSEITTRIEKIKGEVGAENWDLLTPGQQTAVLDVHYANGSLKAFPNLKKGIKTQNAEEIGKNVDFHSGGARNWDRLARNRAESQGIGGRLDRPQDHRRLRACAEKRGCRQPDHRLRPGVGLPVNAGREGRPYGAPPPPMIREFRDGRTWIRLGGIRDPGTRKP